MVAKWNSKTYSYFDMFVDIWLKSLQKVQIMRQIFFSQIRFGYQKMQNVMLILTLLKKMKKKNHPKKLWIENFCAQ
jgi:hypothetical protein